MKRNVLMVIAGLMSVLLISGCLGRESEVQFSRSVLSGLCKGNQKVANSIAWERLQAMGVDAGQAYSKLISEKEKADYRKAFFYNLSYAFRASKGQLSDFTNWRVGDRQGDLTTVFADTSSGKILLMVLSKSAGRLKLVGFGWRQ